MISDEEVMRLFEGADPVRSGAISAPPGDAAGYLDALLTRRGAVTLIEDDPTPIESTDRRRHRRWIIPGAVAAVAAVAAVVSILCGLAIVAREGDQPPAKTEAVDDEEPMAETGPPSGADLAGRGLVGLPRRGASPSTPPTGELVAAVDGRESPLWMYVYADGRVIWTNPQPPPSPATGWLEQRLTPEGVELVRSAIAASGLLDPDRPPPIPGHQSFLRIQVRNGDQLIVVGDGDTAWTDGPDRLHRRLTELWTWLPSTAWADTEVRAWVPSAYLVCIGGAGGSEPLPLSDPSRLVATLPAPAPELLGGAKQLSSDDPAVAVSWRQPCLYEVTTEAARALAATFDAEGWRNTASPDLLFFNFAAPPSVSTTNLLVAIDIRPKLPHGMPALG